MLARADRVDRRSHSDTHAVSMNIYIFFIFYFFRLLAPLLWATSLVQGGIYSSIWRRRCPHYIDRFSKRETLKLQNLLYIILFAWMCDDGRRRESLLYKTKKKVFLLAEITFRTFHCVINKFMSRAKHPLSRSAYSPAVDIVYNIYT